MLVTAPSNLVAYKGEYWFRDRTIIYKARFAGLHGWQLSSRENPEYIKFRTEALAAKRTIIAKYYIEVME